MTSRLSILLLLFLACELTFGNPALANIDESHWQYFKKLTVPESIESDYAFFRVDAEIYDGCGGSLSSLRILDSNSTEAPYQILTKSESEQREEFRPTVLNNSYQVGEFNVFILDIGEDSARVNELTLLTGSENFARRASVEGSMDQHEWNTLVEDAYIFDFSRNVHLKYLTIKFPLSSFRYYRIKIYDDGSGPLKIRGAKLFQVTEEKARTESWITVIIDRKEDTERKTSEAIFDPGYAGLPVMELNLDIISRNYHRKAHVSTSADMEKWTPLGSDIIMNYDLTQFKKTDNRVSFRENREGRYFKVTIENLDDRPLEVTGATAVGLVRRVALPLTGSAPYRIYFGNSRARPPRYDLEHRIQYIDADQLPRLEPGPRRSNPDYVVPTPVRPWSERHAYLLWVTMAVVTAFLAFLIFNLLRKTPPQEPGK